MVMIARFEPTPGYLVLAPDGRVLGRVDLPVRPDLLSRETVLLHREIPWLTSGTARH